jgi:hypothetical protein
MDAVFGNRMEQSQPPHLCAPVPLTGFKQAVGALKPKAAQ